MRGQFICLAPALVLLCLSPRGAHAQRMSAPQQRTIVVSPLARDTLEVLHRIQMRPHVPGKIGGKKVAQYTAEEWGKWIDTTWGPGQSAAQQLNVFDTFWNRIDASWGGFPNLSLKWDSIRALYRPQIGSGLSRGRFAALMSRVWMPLMEHHAYIYDYAVDKTFGNENIGFWGYKAGVPLVVLGTYWWDLLGAPVTALDDSTGLVYRAAVGNPLGLQPGDIILGYEGVPWKKIYPRLLEFGVPINRYWSSPGSTPESRIQLAMSAVGWNWGMFDTIDVVKYATGDTVHLPTAPLATVTQNIWATDQVPVPGVPMPEGGANNTNAVSWGVVQGTNIGYIYVWDWSTASTPQRFADAVADLRYTRKVAGLIIDFRMNWGGEVQYANAGLAKLFGIDPTGNWSFATRASAADHMSFSPIQLNFGFTPDGTSFDRPIAMLTGPGCLSAGDYNAFRLRFHPMARSFGKPTNGAFVAGSQQTGTLEQDWNYEYWPGLMVSRVQGEGYMIHKGVQPDEAVWLTRDGAAKGEDDVVKRALSWISSLMYAHDVALNRYYGSPGGDSVTVTAVLTNPMHHKSEISAVLSDGATVHDSVLFFNDGLHGDGIGGDSIWGARLLAPNIEGNFGISVETKDITQGTSRRLPDVAHLTTAGPLVLTSVDFLDHPDEAYCEVLPYVKNVGATAPFLGGTITLSCADSGVSSVVPAARSFPTIAAGASNQADNAFIINYDPDKFHGAFTLHFSIGLHAHACWDTTYILTVTGIVEDKPVPTIYALEQNFPNPFNPSTTIKFELPKTSHVTLTVYDVLGREVSLLVNEKKNAGSYHVKFDGSNLASGVYFYRIQAGDFVQTKRLLLLK